MDYVALFTGSVIELTCLSVCLSVFLWVCLSDVHSPFLFPIGFFASFCSEIQSLNVSYRGKKVIQLKNKLVGLSKLFFYFTTLESLNQHNLFATYENLWLIRKFSLAPRNNCLVPRKHRNSATALCHSGNLSDTQETLICTQEMLPDTMDMFVGSQKTIQGTMETVPGTRERFTGT